MEEHHAFRGAVRRTIPIDLAERREDLAQYYAAVNLIDEQVGRIIDELANRGELDHTLVVYTADHGHMNGHHGLHGKGNATTPQNFLDESIHVPCLLSWPDHLPPELRVKTPLAGVDLMPTLLDLAGQSLPEPIDGRSVATSILNTEEPATQPIFAEIASLDAIYHGAKEEDRLAAHVMNYDGRWKYIRNRFDIDELYDVSACLFDFFIDYRVYYYANEILYSANPPCKY